MKIIIELPTWLGDAVMASPAIENLINSFDNPKIVLLGSVTAVELLQNHPNVIKTYYTKKNFIDLYKDIRRFGKFDIFVSFRSSWRSKFIKFFVSSSHAFQFDKNFFNTGHQVEKYNNFINESFSMKCNPGDLVVTNTSSKKFSQKRILGINPGASYGVAKKWDPKKFAQLGCMLSSKYDIVIFGGPEDKKIADIIEKYFADKDVVNFRNLAGKTSITQLVSEIASLDLFITGDSGPMHLAAAFKIPTVTIFGPTNDKATSQWLNKRSHIVKKNLECQPCMKRVCPLHHNNCMKLISPSDVLKVINSNTY